MTACPLDGATRVVVDREAAAVWWHCPWCGSTTREVHDETADLMQRWENR